ncbi:MAG: hypothetical protein Q8Q09_12735 [Deltaproteobacteria bacterium]|nr:hypothetical protein [Deltaproteobacteria bacterium]
MRRAWLLIALGISVGRPVLAQSVDSASLARTVASDLVARAEAAARAQQWHRAEAIFVRATHADSSLLPAWLGLADVLRHRGHADEALRALTIASQQAVVDGSSQIAWSRAMQSHGALDQAIAFAERREARPDVLIALAEMCAREGSTLRALALARAARAAGGSASERPMIERLVRALELLAGDTDIVSNPPGRPSTFLRVLALSVRSR